MRVRLIVADQSEARFYDLDGMDAQLHPAGRFVDPDAPVRDPELGAALRGYDRSVDGNSRVAVGSRSASAEPRPRKDAAMRFARQVAAELDAARRRDGFDRIVLMAGPAFIGLLRSALSERVRATLVAEVRKDLITEDLGGVRALVPPESFR
jgi:protein required for attachment to host cells